MERVGAFEAKTHLSQLLERASRGEEIIIEKHGVPVAMLVPVDRGRQRPVGEVITDIEAFRAGRRLDGLTIREMVEEGRR